jgi:HB1, ASXL, restriction endonuclease HTH domain
LDDISKEEKTMAKKSSTTRGPSSAAKEKGGQGKPAGAKKVKGTHEPSSVSGARKVSALDAAARVLAETKEPMSCPELIEAMAVKGYWKSPGGKTPSATLYSALKREIATKQAESRFQQSGPGKFGLA